jgi:hypothetical protein
MTCQHPPAPPQRTASNAALLGPSLTPPRPHPRRDIQGYGARGVPRCLQSTHRFRVMFDSAVPPMPQW